MEMKWIAIMAIGMFGAMFMSLGFSEYYKSQCRIESIKAGVETNKIKEICQ